MAAAMGFWDDADCDLRSSLVEAVGLCCVAILGVAGYTWQAQLQRAHLREDQRLRLEEHAHKVELDRIHEQLKVHFQPLRGRNNSLLFP